ncbi:cob(I)yrinic acid a,c-diamide adenosyltransferase [Sulfurihydrogenibium subterraneum]|uniref:cob(I)yrinic acid a,c-diamide adenosyltransferase n=1 Tax=Sulfurihydrogenibium subterraneum TaxID=171121 RepID=UPI00048C72E1|nr:cob(I)yrinic acid a,c-diamide adenosyltransferase [Sulfurihydrogenibium subterraneum]
MIYVFTGNGKGKTTAAIGTAIRALGNGEKVLFIQFMKDETITSETKILKKLENFTLKSVGRKGFYLPKEMLLKNPDLVKYGVKPIEEIDKQLAYEGLKFVKENIENNDLIVLDEVCIAIYFGLLKVEDVIDLLKSHSDKDFILTGRNCPQELLDMADLVTEMKEVKHPYQKGIKAKKGLDY